MMGGILIKSRGEGQIATRELFIIRPAASAATPILWVPAGRPVNLSMASGLSLNVLAFPYS